MKTLKNLIVTGALYQGEGSTEAVVGNSVALYLDQSYNPALPQSITGEIVSIKKVKCGSSTAYAVKYDEAGLSGSGISFLKPKDVSDYLVITGSDVSNEDLAVEVAARIAGDSSLAPKASPTFTGTVTLPSTTSIGTVSSVELGYLDGVASSIQTQLDSKVSLASPTFTGVPAAPTASTATNTTQIATTAFVKAQGYVPSDSTGITGATEFTNIVRISQVNYDLIGTPDPTTLYFIA